MFEALTAAPPSPRQPIAHHSEGDRGARVLLIPRAELGRLRPVVRPFLERGTAVDGGRSTVIEIWQALERGDSQLWLVTSEDADEVLGVCITAIIKYPRLRALDIEMCAGENVKSWIHLLASDIEPWAKSKGCTVAEGRFRKGWLRYLPDYSTRRILVEKEL